MTSRLMLFAVAGCALTACAPPQPQVRSLPLVTILPPGSQVTQASAASAGATLQPGVPQTARVVAATGVPLRTDFLTVANADCTSGGLARVSLTTMPSHGTVEVDQVEDYPGFAANNQRYACNKQKIPGIAVHYTSAKGYVGLDTFTLSMILPNGSPLEKINIVSVQP